MTKLEKIRAYRILADAVADAVAVALHAGLEPADVHAVLIHTAEVLESEE